MLSTAKYLLYDMHREEDPSLRRKARIGQNASFRGTKQSPIYREALYSIEIASCLAMTRGGICLNLD
jgi:hypothetical protein